jgi:ribonuclease BN (tRNA processing enzyme)
MVRLTFLGTRAEIDEKTESHYYHSSLLLQVYQPSPFRLVIDYGKIHAYDLSILKPDAILITHAHPDHYIWAIEEANHAVPVYLTHEALNYGNFAPVNPKVFSPYKLFSLGPLQIFPYRVIHSIHCPAVGFKIQLPDDQVLIYNPDLVDIIAKEKILPDSDYYIGDGSTIQTNLVRKKGAMLYGHTRISAQIKWCKKCGIENIIFTHIGKDTLREENHFLKIYPEAILAYDEMKLTV